MQKSSLSLSTKILASFIAATLAVFAYFAYSVVISVKESMLTSEKDKAGMLLNAVSQDIAMSLYLGLEKQGAEQARELLTHPDVLAVSLIGGDNKIIGGFESIGADPEELKKAIRVTRPIKDSLTGKHIATLDLKYSNRNYKRLLDDFKDILTKFIAISAFIFIFTLLYVKKLLSPLSQIAGTIREYVPGKKIAFDRKESDDEIGTIITSFKAMQNNIDASLEEIRKKDGELMRQSKLKALMDMMNAVAHHWRQPLNAIGIILQDFKYAYKYEELDEKYIETNVEISMGLLNNMSKTIDDFRLFFASSEKEEQISVLNIINEALLAIRSQMSFLNIKIEISGDDFIVSGQKELLRDVCHSIITNSKDAICEKSEHNRGFVGEITIKLDPALRTVEFLDNGGGFCDEAMSRVFEPYFSTKEQGKGVGLGLFMSRTAIANMNGDLTVSNENGGAKVLISF